MTITTAAIKLLASARMTDAADSGGAMTGTALQDGVENNVFPDISSLDRAQGALQFRKIYPAVLSTDTDVLLGAHVVLDMPPADAAVSSIVMRGASAGQQLSALASALNAAGVAYGYKGTATLTATLSSGSVNAVVNSTYAQLIPKTLVGDAVSGDVTSETVEGWAATGLTVAMTLRAATYYDGGGALVTNLVIEPAPGVVPFGAARIRRGSIAGTATIAGNSATVTSSPEGLVTASWGGGAYTFTPDAGVERLVGPPWPSGSVSSSLTGEVLVPVDLPKLVATFTVGTPNLPSYEFALPAGTALQSESIAVSYGGTTTQWACVQGTPALAPAPGYSSGLFNSATISRGAGVLTMTATAAVPAGVSVRVTYAMDGITSNRNFASLSNSGVVTSGEISLTLSAGKVFGAADFTVGGTAMAARGGVIRRLSDSAVRGTYTDAGVMSMPLHDGQALANWYAVQRDAEPAVRAASAVLPVNIDPASLTITGLKSTGVSFTATASNLGVFATAHVTGTYTKASGALSLAFAANTNLASLDYAGTQVTAESAVADLHGLVLDDFPDDGKVPVLNPGDVVVLQNIADTSPATASNGGTVNCGRGNLAAVRVIGNNGAAILSGWTVDLVTGVVTWVNVSGWSQPVKVRHSIDHMAVLASTAGGTAVTLNLPPARDFAAGSTLSSALLLGDLRASAGLAFSQLAWTDVWSDSRIGSAILGQYQDLAHPIVVTNAGAVSERWAIIFTTSTAFRLVGETVGQIATGTVNDPLAPVNPATAVPYFSLAETGWGSGWAAGNVLRFNTTGANAPVWVTRTVMPSAPGGADQITLALRGDINA